MEIDFFFLDELKLPQKISLQLLTGAIEQLVEDFNELYFHVPDVAEREAKKLTIRKRVSSEMPDRHQHFKSFLEVILVEYFQMLGKIHLTKIFADFNVLVR